jgi:8-oxo-dGTP pyrophosphatase MutT (NUDIX family)
MRIADRLAPHTVESSETGFTGRVWSVVTERVAFVDGVAPRDVLHHPGAVAVMAEDDEGRVYLVHQYRHPVRRQLWEPPAGLLDVADEDPLAAARRELAEEADLVAQTWHVLADLYTSPGGSSEAIRIYLARDLGPVPEEHQFAREAEEAEMLGEWVSLDVILAAIAAGDVCGPTLTVGAYALDAARRSGGATLRPADAPWPAREGVPR